MAENEGGVPIEATPTIEIGATVQMGGASSESNAEAWAVGERHGVPVGSSDQTYHNNSKYYAEQAGSEAEDAEAWSNGTRNGVPVESSDPAYQKSGKYYNDQMAAALEEVTRQAVVEAAGNAEAWAVGERGGTAVPDTEVQFSPSRE